MKIVNIICSGSFNQKVKLESLFCLDPAIFQYDPEMHHAAYLNINGKKIIFYNTGKYIFMGLQTQDEIANQYNQMKLVLSPFLKIDLFNSPKIQNIVVTDSIFEQVNLIDFVKRNRKIDIQYNPTKFSGLIYRTNHGTALLFSNGKIVITGIKNINDVAIIKQELVSLISKSNR